jgi:branched-chain amino acid transport system substrate-binding protein
MYQEHGKTAGIVYTAIYDERLFDGMTMRSYWRPALLAAVAALLLASPEGKVCAQQPTPSAARVSDGVVKIGLILDMSGPYSETTGSGSATAAKMALEDFGGQVLGTPIEIVIADHNNSPNRAAAIARDWFEIQHVDAIMDVTGSSEGLIVQRIGDVRDKIVSLSSAVAARLSNEACTSTSIHYVSDTRAIAHTLGTALVARGADTWFFITVDYSFGYDLESDTSAVVTEGGGKVLGHARYPLGAQDYTAYLARARESGAKVIGLANAGGDLTQTIRQASQHGMIPGPQVLAGLALRINGVHTLGLETAQSLMLSESFYWDRNEATRTWSKRFFERVKMMPNSLQAGVYSSTMHYLRAIASAKTDATEAVLLAMRAMPVNDFFAHNGHIRADGVMVHDLNLFQVKPPAESHYPWDYYRLIATIPGEKAFGPVARSKCPLVMPVSDQ